MEMNDHIHIFKTNIEYENLPFIRTSFAAIRAIVQWNVDIEDCDHVLRIVSYDLSENEIIQIVSGHGFICEGLN